MVYREWLEQWLTAKLAKVKESSYSSYKINIDTHIIPLLGDKEVEEIDEDMLQDVLDLMEKSGNRKTGLKLSEKTIGSHQTYQDYNQGILQEVQDSHAFLQRA